MNENAVGNLIEKISTDYYREDAKIALVSAIVLMGSKEADSFLAEITALVEFKNAHVGKFAFDKKEEPSRLLQRFWQRSSDACPLDATESEKQENEFHDWVIDQYEELTFKI